MRSTLRSARPHPSVLPSGPPHSISNQLARGGGPGWRIAPWVESLVTVAKAAASPRWWDSSFGSLGLRGQGLGQSRGGDGEADDPDIRQGEAHCPEAATRGTGRSSEGAGAAGPPRLGRGGTRGAWAPGRGWASAPVPLGSSTILRRSSEGPAESSSLQPGLGQTDTRALPRSTALWG